MSNSLRLVVALSLGIVFILTVSVFAFAGDTTAGSAAYQQYCAGCHGANGAGTQYGPDIIGEGGDTAEVVRQGDDEMPAYDSSIISDGTLGSLSAYIDSLGGSDERSGDDQYDRDDEGDHHDSDDDHEDEDRYSSRDDGRHSASNSHDSRRNPDRHDD